VRDNGWNETTPCFREPAFASVRDALASSITSNLEVGAHLTVYADKQCVVDLWAGHADAARTRPWQDHTLVNLFSVGKAISAVCLLRLVEAGRVDLDAPVARYWPEFAQAGRRASPRLSGTEVMNTRAWRAAEVPSTNGYGTARAVARLYSALATDGRLDGVHVLGTETIARAITEQVNGPDLVLERPTRYGLGFQLTMPERRLGSGPRAFGHFGAGGSLGFADPDARVAIGYATNQGRPGWQHAHVRRLIDLVYAAL
jgi:CubicO group peptidase (beta-lactamase class C family)